MQRGDHTVMLNQQFLGIKLFIVWPFCSHPHSQSQALDNWFSIVGREYYLEDLMDLEEPMIWEKYRSWNLERYVFLKEIKEFLKENFY